MSRPTIHADGPRWSVDPRDLLVNGWRPYGYTSLLVRTGDVCELRAYVSRTDATADVCLELPEEFMPSATARPVGQIYQSAATSSPSFIVSGAQVVVRRSALSQSQVMLSAMWTVTDKHL